MTSPFHRGGGGEPADARTDQAGRPPLGRTSAEIHLYLDLHPCACGELDFDRSSAVHDSDGVLVALYQAACPRCGRERRFAFRLPDQPIASGAEGASFRFGDAQPSELLDPGEWILVADALSKSVPLLSPSSTAQERERFRYAVGRAAAAIDEVAKFVPAGAEAVPPAAFVTRRGRAAYDAEPGRFRLLRLDAVRSAYRGLLTESGLA